MKACNRDTIFRHLQRDFIQSVFSCFYVAFNLLIVFICFCWYFIFEGIHNKSVPNQAHCEKITFSPLCVCVCVWFENERPQNMIIFCWFDGKSAKQLHFHCGNESIDSGTWLSRLSFIPDFSFSIVKKSHFCLSNAPRSHKYMEKGREKMEHKYSATSINGLKLQLNF